MISKNFSLMLLSVLLTMSANLFASGERLLPINAVDIKTDLQQFISEDASYYKIGKIKVKEIPVNENENYYFISKQDGEKGIDDVIAIIDKIIVIGEKLWKIVEKGRPVVNTSTQKVSVLPYLNGQVMTAMELQNWSMPKFKKFSVVYENKYGMKVIEFTYLVQFIYGGNLRGAGKYLSNVTISVEKLNISWGFDMDASSVINNVANHGTKENPVAGVTMQMGFKVNTVFQHLENTLSYHVTGDGKLLEM